MRFLVVLLIICSAAYPQIIQPFSQFKIFRQTLSSVNVQFLYPKDFKEIKPLHTANMDFDYALELPNTDFQVWYMVKSTQQEQARIKATEDDLKHMISHPDSLYKELGQATAIKLAGKGNFTSHFLPQDALSSFKADEGRYYQLNLFDMAATSHFQYGLLISLQKNGSGSISMLFLSNDNGPEFYKNVNRAYYSVRFN